jgi:hypothetical protein
MKRQGLRVERKLRTARQKRQEVRFLWPRAGAHEKDIRRSSIVQVDWTDAAGSHGWKDISDDCGLVKCTSVGFLLHRKRDHLTLATGLSNEHSSNAQEAIPLKWIQRIKVLQRAPLTAKKRKK